MAYTINVAALRWSAIVLTGVLSGLILGWHYNSKNKIAEFYVVRGKTGIQTPLYGFKCQCYVSGNTKWKGGNSAKCNNKNEVQPVKIRSNLNTPPGSCCQGTSSINSPVINNKKIFKDLAEDPCL